MAAEGERVAVNEQAIRDLRGGLQEVRQALNGLGARVGSVEDDMASMMAERREERRLAKARQDSIQTWFRMLTFAATLGGVLISATILLTNLFLHK